MRVFIVSNDIPLDLLSVLFGGSAERDACVMVAERGGHDGVDGCPGSLDETGYALARACAAQGDPLAAIRRVSAGTHCPWCA